MYPIKQPSELIQKLSSSPKACRVQALKSLKNLVIGNPKKKQIMADLGIIPILVDILHNENNVREEELLIQSAATLGSLAMSEELIPHILKADPGLIILTNYLKMIPTPSTKLVEAIARSVFNILAYTKPQIVQHVDIVKVENISTISTLLESSSNVVTEMAACIIRIGSTWITGYVEEVCRQIQTILPLLVKMISARYPRTQEVALYAISSLLRSLSPNTKDICDRIASDNHNLELITSLCMNEREKTKILAIKCVAHMYRNNSLEGKIPIQTLSKNLVSEINKIFQSFASGAENLSLLLNVDHMENMATMLNILCILMDEDTMFQENFLQTNILSKLLIIFQKIATSEEGFFGSLISRQVKLEFLQTFKILCSSKEEARKAVSESTAVLKSILSFIGKSNVEYDDELELYCLEVLLMLTRAQTQLRSILIEQGLQQQLAKLVKTSHNVLAALKVYHNLVLDFASIKDFSIDENLVEHLVFLVFNESYDIQILALRTLKNILYQSSIHIKRNVLKYLTPESLLRLALHNNKDIQIIALRCVRNILYGEPNNSNQDCEILSIEVCKQFIDIIIKNLNDSQSSDDLITESLYVLSNILSCNDNAKRSLVMNRSLLDVFFGKFSSKNKERQMASLWVILNMTYKGTQDDNEFLKQVSIALKEFDLAEILRSIDSSDFAISDLVKEAQQQLANLQDSSNTQ